MHEYSVVQSFLEMCEEYVRQNQCTRVVSAKIKAGVLSGIELSLFQRALETFKEESVLKDAEISYLIQPLDLECFKCAQKSTSSKLQIQCPHCLSQDVRVLDGEEFVLLNLEME